MKHKLKQPSEARLEGCCDTPLPPTCPAAGVSRQSGVTAETVTDRDDWRVPISGCLGDFCFGRSSLLNTARVVVVCRLKLIVKGLMYCKQNFTEWQNSYCVPVCVSFLCSVCLLSEILNSKTYWSLHLMQRWTWIFSLQVSLNVWIQMGRGVPATECLVYNILKTKYGLRSLFSDS